MKGRRHSVVQWLRNAETGFTKNGYRANLKLLSSIIRQDDVTFEKCWSRNSKKPIIYDDGRLYFENFKECFTLSGDHYLPHKLYNLDLMGHKRIVDTLIYTAPIHKVPIPSTVFTPMFLALTDDNWLLRYHNLTGALLEQIYLGNKCKYLHIDWETQGESIVLQSRQGIQQSKVLQTIAVFTIYPLQFVCAFDVSKDVFENDIKSANISEGLLIIGSGSGVTKQVRLYSLHDVMQPENFLCNCKLNDECDLITSNSDLSERQCLKVGIDGIPVNISLKKPLSLLFHVNCCEEVVYFGGYPWHYIYSPAKQKGVFEVMNLESHESPENGQFQLENNSLEPDNLSFHVDDSGRLIYSSAHDVTFYKLNDNKEISKLFVLGMTPSLNDSLRVEIESPPKLYTPRRCRKKKNYCDIIEDRTVLADDYENELEFFSLLGIDKEAGRFGKIVMFDNDDGSLVKEFDVGFKLHEECEYNTVMDVDSFIITVKDENNWSVHVYRMKSKTILQEIKNRTKQRNGRKKIKKN